MTARLVNPPELAAARGYSHGAWGRGRVLAIAGQIGWDASSKLVSPEFQAGVVGYFYQQITGDSGSGATLGDFKGRVAGIGPQAGWFFKVGEHDWYANLKGYYEFAAKNRAEGWNVWVTLAIPLGG